MKDSQYVQYGCGFCAPSNWRNFDASLTLKYEKLPVLGKLYKKNVQRFPANVEVGNIVKGLPVPENSCRLAYCSHVLEHLSLHDCQKAIRNTYRILESGGLFRFVLPDLEYYIKQYTEDSTPGAAQNFMQGTILGRKEKPRSINTVLFEWLRTSAHLWMWDYKALKQELESAGFTDVRRAAFGDSSESEFGAVEAENRWENCLGIECRKP